MLNQKNHREQPLRKGIRIRAPRLVPQLACAWHASNGPMSAADQSWRLQSFRRIDRRTLAWALQLRHPKNSLPASLARQPEAPYHLPAPDRSGNPRTR